MTDVDRPLANPVTIDYFQIIENGNTNNVSLQYGNTTKHSKKMQSNEVTSIAIREF